MLAGIGTSLRVRFAGAEFGARGWPDFVVLDGQRVDRLVFVDAAEDLALRARLRLFDFDRRQFGRRRFGGAARGATGHEFAVGREVRFVPWFEVDESFGFIRVAMRFDEFEERRRRFDFVGEDVFGAGAEVGDVFEEERRFVS